MKKLGLLGGSFDPIHFGHLNLAINLWEIGVLDEVLFCPNALSPFKLSHPPHASIKHRLQMVRLAIDPLPAFRLLDWEAQGEGPHYTIDTVKRLYRETPEVSVHLLLGEDIVPTIFQWKEGNDLVQLAPPLVGVRSTESKSTAPFQTIKMPSFDISSTQIRQRLQEKKHCGHLLPFHVLDYIETHHLYERR